MRACVYDTAGPDQGVLRVEEVPDPEPGPGEVRVRIAVAGVNPTDVKAREGGTRARPWPLQAPGQDGAGVIDRVGPGVDGARVGQRVWVHLAGHGHPWGTAAERVVVRAERAVPLGPDVPFEVGASLGVPAVTAHRCLFADGPVDGLTVLVTGGGGAVGHAAIQIARLAGARVLTTVSGPERAAIARTAGPDTILEYTDPAHRDQLRRAAPDGIDRVVDVDFSANIAAYHDLLTQGAVIANYASPEPSPAMVLPSRSLRASNVLVRFVLLYGVPDARLAEGAAHVAGLVDDGRWVTPPLIVLPLAAVDEAHERVRGGAMGKVLLDLSAEARPAPQG